MPTAKSKKKSVPKNEYKSYEQALKLISQKKYAQARDVLTGIEEDPATSAKLLAQTKVYLRVCRNFLAKESPLDEKNSDQMYENGIFLHNDGQLEQALQCFAKALKASKEDAPHIHYAMAATECLRRNTEEAIGHLEQAVQLDETQRFLAANDPDMESLRSHKNFQALLGQTS